MPFNTVSKAVFQLGKGRGTDTAQAVEHGENPRQRAEPCPSRQE